MDVSTTKNYRQRFDRSAFTVIEAIVAVSIIGILTLALYSGMTSTTFSIRLARENQRATEIMMEKTECLRLYSWDQLTNSAVVPTSFTGYYYDTGATNGIGMALPTPAHSASPPSPPQIAIIPMTCVC